MLVGCAIGAGRGVIETGMAGAPLRRYRGCRGDP